MLPADPNVDVSKQHRDPVSSRSGLDQRLENYELEDEQAISDS